MSDRCPLGYLLLLCFIEILVFNVNSEDPDQHLIWVCTVCQLTILDLAWSSAYLKPRTQKVIFLLISYSITKTCLYNFDPLKPHFYKVKLGFTGVYIIFLISTQNIDCGYSLEPPRRGGSNEYPQSMFCAEIWKISDFFYLKIFIFWW